MPLHNSSQGALGEAFQGSGLQNMGRRLVIVRALTLALTAHLVVVFFIGFDETPDFRRSPPVVNFDISHWGAHGQRMSQAGEGMPGLGQDQQVRPTSRTVANLGNPDTYASAAASEQANQSPRRALITDLADADVERLLGGKREEQIRRLQANSDEDSPATRYLNSWQRSVESTAALYLPLDVKNLSGSLTIRVVLNADGKTLLVEILTPSANYRLDQLALEVLRIASPFPPFQEDLRALADEVEIIRRWRFFGSDHGTLSASVSAVDESVQTAGSIR